MKHKEPETVARPGRRALYWYTCKRCGHHRASLVYRRAKEGICMLHREPEVNPAQQELFPKFGIAVHRMKGDILGPLQPEKPLAT